MTKFPSKKKQPVSLSRRVVLIAKNFLTADFKQPEKILQSLLWRVLKDRIFIRSGMNRVPKLYR